MKRKQFIIPLWTMLLASCASVNTAYFPRATIKLSPKKDAGQVEVLTAPPTRASAILGEIALGGNASCNYQTLIDAAQKKAAALGADFIVVFKTTTEYRPYVTPGYGSSSGFGSGYGYGNGNSWQASSQYTASSYAVGPSAGVLALPTMNVIAGVYFPARLGVEWDKTVTNKSVIAGFSLGSKAEEAGLMKGDEVVGVDGIEMRDSRAPAHFMQFAPGQKVPVTIERNGERKEVVVDLISN